MDQKSQLSGEQCDTNRKGKNAFSHRNWQCINNHYFLTSDSILGYLGCILFDPMAVFHKVL